MKKTRTDEMLQSVLTTSIQNKTVDTRIAETLERIRQGEAGTAGRPNRKQAKVSSKHGRTANRTGKRRKVIYGAGAAAAVLFISICICAANPAMAADIPILGSIFLKVQEFFPFGKIPEDETTKLYEKKNDEIKDTDKNTDTMVEKSSIPETEKKEQSGEDEENKYRYGDSDQGITVMFTEYYASNQAIYFGVCIENEEAFPAFATMGETDYQLIQVNTRETYSFRDDGDREISGFHNIEGRLTDAHTFAGVMRVDYDSINVDARKYNAACDAAEAKGEELPALTAESQDQYLDYYEVPEAFEMQMKIERLQGYCEEAVSAEDGNKYKVRGEWSFDTVRIQQSDKDVQTIEIHEVNEQGIGIERIEISPVELTLHIVEPTDHLLYGVVLDKDGRLLTAGSSNAYELAITGHDISTVTVYICDYDEYMDEIKAYGLEDDSKLQKALEEKALFKKVVFP